MALVEIPLSNTDPAFNFSIELDGATYFFRFRWNGRIETWVFDLLDSNRDPIQLGNPFIVGFILLRQYQGANKPPGTLYAINTTGSGLGATRFNIGKDVKFFYQEAE